MVDLAGNANKVQFTANAAIHIQGRQSFTKPTIALQLMASLVYVWWRLQWLGPYQHFQLSCSFLHRQPLHFYTILWMLVKQEHQHHKYKTTMVISAHGNYLDHQSTDIKICFLKTWKIPNAAQAFIKTLMVVCMPGYVSAQQSKMTKVYILGHICPHGQTHIHIQTHTHTHTHTYTYTLTHTHTHTHTHMYARTHTLTHTLTHTPTCMHAPKTPLGNVETQNISIWPHILE